jgi:hypothetical protein
MIQNPVLVARGFPPHVVYWWGLPVLTARLLPIGLLSCGYSVRAHNYCDYSADVTPNQRPASCVEPSDSFKRPDTAEPTHIRYLVVGRTTQHSATSHSHLHRDLLVRLVVDELEVGIREAVDILDIRVDTEGREGAGGVAELHLECIDMRGVDVRVAKDMEELAGLQAADLRATEGQFGVSGHAAAPN